MSDFALLAAAAQIASESDDSLALANATTSTAVDKPNQKTKQNQRHQHHQHHLQTQQDSGCEGFESSPSAASSPGSYTSVASDDEFGSATNMSDEGAPEFGGNGTSTSFGSTAVSSFASGATTVELAAVARGEGGGSEEGAMTSQYDGSVFGVSGHCCVCNKLLTKNGRPIKGGFYYGMRRWVGQPCCGACGAFFAHQTRKQQRAGKTGLIRKACGPACCTRGCRKCIGGRYCLCLLVGMRPELVKEKGCRRRRSGDVRSAKIHRVSPVPSPSRSQEIAVTIPTPVPQFQHNQQQQQQQQQLQQPLQQHPSGGVSNEVLNAALVGDPALVAAASAASLAIRNSIANAIFQQQQKQQQQTTTVTGKAMGNGNFFLPGGLPGPFIFVEPTHSHPGGFFLPTQAPIGQANPVVPRSGTAMISRAC